MGTVAVVVLVLWLVGIGLSLYGTVTVLKAEDDPRAEQFQALYDQHPLLSLTVLTVLTVFWPATVVFNLAKSARS